MLMALFTLAEQLPHSWLAFIDNTAGEAALRKGYGKDAFVNGMLAAFWGTAARRGWRSQFARVESKANVADAVSRGGLSRAIAERWTRLDDHAETITEILSSERPLTPSTRPARRWTTSTTPSTEPARSGGQRGRRAGVRSAPCPVPPSFGGGTSDHAREALLRIQKDVPLKCPRYSACRFS